MQAHEINNAELGLLILYAITNTKHKDISKPLRTYIQAEYTKFLSCSLQREEITADCINLIEFVLKMHTTNKQAEALWCALDDCLYLQAFFNRFVMFIKQSPPAHV